MTLRIAPASILLCVLTVAVVLVPVGAALSQEREETGEKPSVPPGRESGKVTALEEETRSARAPIPIRPPRIKPAPEDGEGRLSITFDGNRRWCTYPDDRLQQIPTKMPATPERRREVFTFGYQFSVAAVERTAPDETHLLYLSPVIRTASLRQAGKLGRGQTPGRATTRNKVVVPSDEEPGTRRRIETSAALVPYWDQAQRCATVGEQFDFDIDPGLYDLYLSFDIMLRSGAWVHRTYAYLTEVEVEGGRRTLVDGLINMGGGGMRQLELRSASIEPLSPPGAARR